MIRLQRTDARNEDFVALVELLDIHMAKVDGVNHAFYDQFNKLDKIKHVIVTYDDGSPVACGSIKEYEKGVMEVKRMYVKPESRGKGIGVKILVALEDWAQELSAHKYIIETGTENEVAIHLYKKNGYTVIPNYGQYAGVETSICFEKHL
ncbi:GNAT family N-acetyltransferase [Galbibacter sp. EGI 63066]|uniref:GNAT family N-acetyltransferase n=1 Tax=Galbibacter sp. EGI 63066 TaxID=2993559 RepID=UPI002248EDC9|nr:GNAT family N-acetyltransferase [Galbibacter sp. EGI 63066]MCX2680818.1 GNAT family N-acetyltransferase [Galbibacter sp. EGI 63066]